MIEVGAVSRRVAALARRDLHIERSYRLRYATRMLQVLVGFIVVYYVGTLIEAPPELERYGGSYFDFAIVGLAVMSVAQLGISTFNQTIMREQTQGTFEVTMATPTSVPTLLAGSFVLPLILTTIDLTLYLGIGLGVIGGGFRVIGLLLGIPALALTLLSFCAFGIVGACVMVLAKRGDPLTAPLTAMTSLLSGALFPVSALPVALEVLARFFPAYYGINAVRESLLTDDGWREIMPDIAILVAFDAVLLPTSLYLFNRALAVSRRTGTLANY